MKKFRMDVVDWFADVADHLNMFWTDARIRGVKIEFDLERDLRERKILCDRLDFLSDNHNFLLGRIRNRQERHEPGRA